MNQTSGKDNVFPFVSLFFLNIVKYVMQKKNVLISSLSSPGRVCSQGWSKMRVHGSEKLATEKFIAYSKQSGKSSTVEYLKDI